MAKIGAHVSAAGGVYHAPANAVAEQLETFQMFSRPPQSFRCPPLSTEDIEKFLAAVKTAGFTNYYIHAPYLVNIASAKPALRHGSITMLRQELERGSALKVRGVMFHVGSAASQPSREIAMAVAIKSLNQILAGYAGTCQLLLENAAGAGSVLGCTLAELGQLYQGIVDKQRVGFCFDTQHAFGSGYDLRTKAGVNAMIKELDKYLGLKNLTVIQINDSKVEFNSKKDRHEHIGLGKIGSVGIGFVLKHPKLKHLDFILETPANGRANDVKILKQLRKA
ncbi:MAG: hypothetical protein ACD_21C00326G0004 [uncultured bacterium]|nr:MAG: hypothetical protein ACD_21C00326G0004 [uncultured bacterium]